MTITFRNRSSNQYEVNTERMYLKKSASSTAITPPQYTTTRNKSFFDTLRPGRRSSYALPSVKRTNSTESEHSDDDVYIYRAEPSKSVSARNVRAVPGGFRRIAIERVENSPSLSHSSRSPSDCSSTSSRESSGSQQPPSIELDDTEEISVSELNINIHSDVASGHNNQIQKDHRIKWIPELHLTYGDERELVDGEMLSDKHMWAAQKLLQKQFHDVRGLQDTCLCQTSFQQVGSGAVQIHHTRGGHWVVSSTMDDENVVNVYDTLYRNLAPDLQRQLSEMYGHMAGPNGRLEVNMLDVQHQNGYVDCGLFAIAIAYELCRGKRNPEDIVFDQSLMREHLHKCFEQRTLRSFPHRSQCVRSGMSYPELVTVL